MLARSQVRALLDEGRALVNSLALSLEQYSELQKTEREAFSLGIDESLTQIEGDKKVFQLEIRNRRESLATLLAQLRKYAEECLDEYRADMKLEGIPSTMPLPPPPPSQFRLEDYEPYFLTVEDAVSLITQQLLDFRQKALSSVLREVHNRLSDLHEYSESLPAVEEYIQQATFLDLPLVDARHRLRDEVELINRRIQDCERARKEEEQARLLQAAKTALANLELLGEPEAQGAIPDLQKALMLSSLPDPADRKKFWAVCSRLLPLSGPYLRDPLLTRALELVEDSLSPQSEGEPLELLMEVGDALAPLDILLTQERTDDLQRFAEQRLRDVHPPLAASRLCRLKAALPITSFVLFRSLAKIIPISATTVASWFVALPSSFSSAEAIEWLASLFANEQAWREAFAGWSTIGDVENAHAALLISLADSPDLIPDSADTWWEIVSRNPDSYSGGRLTAVAAITSYIMGQRAEMASLCDTAADLTNSLTRHLFLKSVLAAATKVFPASLKHELWESTHPRERLAVLHRDIEGKLKSLRKGAGGAASYNFHRDCLLPELNKRYRDHGPSGLVELGEELVNDLYRQCGFQLNSSATETFVEFLSDLSAKAREFMEAETNTKALWLTPSEEDLLKGLQREEKIEGADNPILKWVYQSAINLVKNDPSLPGHTRAFSPQSLYSELFRGNPLVDLGKPSDGAALLVPAIKSLINEGAYDSWRVQCALDMRNFAKADEYCKSSPPKEQAALRAGIDDARVVVRSDLRERLQFVRDFLGTLDRDTKVLDFENSLDKLVVEIEQGDLEKASMAVQTAYRTCDELEKAQREERESAAEAARVVLDRAFERLCNSKEKGGELRTLVANLILNTDGSGALLRQYGEAIQSSLNDLPFDRSLITLVAGNSIESSTLTDSISVSIPELAPAEFSSLPSLVRADLESRAGDRGQTIDVAQSEDILRTATSSMDRIRVAFTLYMSRRASGNEWEEPLVAYLEEKGHQSFNKRDFLRAEEFYLAAAQVSYRASSRLLSGLSALRRTAFNHAFAHLQRLRSSYGSADSDVRPAHSSTPRDWVSLIQGYLLIRASTDLAHVLGMLATAAPTVMPEFLELPLSEIAPLRMSLVQILLETLGTPRSGDYELLEFVATYRIALEERSEVRANLKQLRDLATMLAETPHLSRSDRVFSSLSDLAARFEGMGGSNEIRQVLISHIERLKGLASVTADPSKTEAVVSAITREVYLDALDGSRDTPLHLRVSLAPESAFLRDVEITFRCDHPDIEILDSDKVVELLRLEGDKKKEAAEVAVRIRRKTREVASIASLGEPVPLTLEIGHIGLRQGGLLRGGLVPYKGKKQNIVVHRVYPYSQRPNPYSVGTAVRNLLMIKGRDDETRDIFRTLHGRYQDNVPLIWGARRIGKSTLLYRIKLDAEVRSHYEPVICDIEYLIREKTSHTPSFLSALAETISQELVGTQAGRVSVPEIRDAPDCLAAFRSYLDNVALACDKRSLLLMFDEMDFFFDRLRQDKAAGRVTYSQGLHEDIIHTLRHYMQHKKGVSFLLSGTKSLLEMSGNVSERLFHMPLPIKVTELSSKSAEALMTEPVEELFSYSAAARDRMLFLTNSHPYFLQGICYELFRLMQDQHLSVCSIAELNQAIQQRVMNQTPTFSFQYDELKMTSQTKVVGRAIAELTQEDRRADLDAIVSRVELVEDRHFSSNSLEQALMALTNSEILTRSSRGYRFRVPLMALYVNTRNQELAA